MSAGYRAAIPALLFLAVGTCGGFLVSIATPPVYRSNGSIRAQQVGSVCWELSTGFAGILSRRGGEALVSREQLYWRALDREVRLDDVTDLLTDDIQIEPFFETGARPEVRVSFEYADRKTARRTTRGIVSVIAETASRPSRFGALPDSMPVEVRQPQCAPNGWRVRQDLSRLLDRIGGVAEADPAPAGSSALSLHRGSAVEFPNSR